jgi:hypothetical protein
MAGTIFLKPKPTPDLTPYAMLTDLKWTSTSSGTIEPSTNTDRVLVGGAVDDTTSALQVAGKGAFTTGVEGSNDFLGNNSTFVGTGMAVGCLGMTYAS